MRHFISFHFIFIRVLRFFFLNHQRMTDFRCRILGKCSLWIFIHWFATLNFVNGISDFLIDFLGFVEILFLLRSRQYLHSFFWNIRQFSKIIEVGIFFIGLLTRKHLMIIFIGIIFISFFIFTKFSSWILFIANMNKRILTWLFRIRTI